MTPLPIDTGDEATSKLLGILLKVGAYAGTFLGGVVSATWAIARKVKGWEDRLTAVETNQKKCQSEVLIRLDSKLDFIIQDGFPKVHERIDAVLLKGVVVVKPEQPAHHHPSEVSHDQ